MAAPSLSITRIGARSRPAPLAEIGLRLAERAVAGLALAALAPALACVLGAVRFLSGRAPLVAHARIGQFGEPFWVLKIRTMWRSDSLETPIGGWVEYLNDPTVPAIKDGVDPRVTSRFAAFCRRHSIDELPQLAHVLSGKMRIVGPRPMTSAELCEHYGDAQADVLAVAPGLTGLWQVMGRNRLSYAQRRRLDVFFVRRGNWRLSLWILARTVIEVLAPRDAW